MVEQIYEKYHEELCKWCSMMTRDSILAEDLVQEAWLRAILYEDIFSTLQESQKRAWLYRTVKNLYVDKIRRQSREIISDTLPAQQEAAKDCENVYIEQFLGCLTPEERLLFIMRYFQGYRSNELGKIFNLPAGTVRSRLSTARKRLRDVLKCENQS